MPRTTGIISAISCGFSPASTSSSSSSRGCVASARASSSRLRPATVRSEAGLSSCGARPTRCATSSACAQRRAAGSRQRRCAPTAMFSRTVCCAKGCTIWKVRVMPQRALRCGARPVMSSPVEEHAAAVRLEEAGHQREQRRLARAVGADQRAQAAARQVQADVAAPPSGPPKACETPAHATAAAQPSRPPPRARTPPAQGTPMPATPRGRNITISTSTDAVDHHVDARQLAEQVAREVGQQMQRQRAEHRAPQRAHAADDGRDQRLDRGGRAHRRCPGRCTGTPARRRRRPRPSGRRTARSRPA